MDMLFTLGIYVIDLLQQRFADYNIWMSYVSQVFDPKHGYDIHFPVVFAISQVCGVKMIYACAVSECLNLLLKWLFQEDRPYWWVLENPDKVYDVSLVQYPITCETGPGSPSGHVMISTTLWYVVVATAEKQLSYFLRLLLWLAFFGLIALIAVSRMFVAAHFPHQCALGFIIGIGLGKSFMKMKTSTLRRSSLLFSSLLLFLSTIVLYTALGSLGLDPNRSITKAIKWCSDPKYVHIDTSPLFCCMRYTGALAGVAMSFWDSDLKNRMKLKPKYVFILVAMFGLFCTKLFSYIPYPTATIPLYVTSFLKHFFLLFCIMRLGPEIIAQIVPVKSGMDLVKKRE